MNHTSLDAIVNKLVEQIVRVVPRYEPDRERSRWRHVEGDVRGAARSFDVIPSLPAETPGGAYGDGIQYHASLTIRVAYDELTDKKANLMAAGDLEDLTALLVRLHHDVDGMFPIETEPSRGEPVLTPTVDTDTEEGRRVVEFRVVVHYLASDTVQME